MRNFKRDQSTIYYALFQEDSAVDKYGNRIGGYTTPTRLKISLSAAKGDSNYNVFGKDTDYDREMVTTDTDCPINEYSRLWIGVDTSKTYNYVVTKVATSKREKRYAIKEHKG